MVNSFLTTIGTAVKSLNPHDVRIMADKPVDIGLHALDEKGLNSMWYWLAPPPISEAKRDQLALQVHPVEPQVAGMQPTPAKIELHLYQEGLRKPREGFTWYPNDLDRTVREILDKRDDLVLPLSRQYLPFRKSATDRIVGAVCQENLLFSVATSLPNIVPSFLSLPFAVGEFASDTAFLTMNQLRMAFMLAGAHDHPIGYREQKAQIASVIAGAFGWRAIARELVSKIPFGGGVVGKAGISYAGTWLVGRSLERLYRVGGHLTPEERKDYYAEGMERGKQAAQKLLESMRPVKK